MSRIRVAAFIDGFNLYHAIHDIGREELKWLDLKKVVACFTDPDVHEIVDVFYFSAYAKWLPEPHQRHVAYVQALKAMGITPILGNFKTRHRNCRNCGNSWVGHEEKESDVNIAVWMIRYAVEDIYDQAFLISGDSDLVAPLSFIREKFPEKKIKLICPPGRRHSKELWKLATNRAKIKAVHLEQSRLPDVIHDAMGKPMITCPEKYLLPAK